MPIFFNFKNPRNVGNLIIYFWQLPFYGMTTTWCQLILKRGLVAIEGQHDNVSYQSNAESIEIG